MLKFREKCLNVAVSLRNSAVRRCSPARSGRPAVKRFARQPSALRLRCSDGVAAWCISAGNACVRCVLPVHSSVLPALSGPHYSIAAGEGSEPAEERQKGCGPHGGPTPVAVVRRMSGYGDVPAVVPCCGSTPLGPQMMCTSLRGFAPLTRGYRVVRPRWGRCLRGSRPRCVRAVLMAWLRGAFPRKSLMAAAYLWCVRRVCRPYRGRTIL